MEGTFFNFNKKKQKEKRKSEKKEIQKDKHFVYDEINTSFMHFMWKIILPKNLPFDQLIQKPN